MLATGVCLLMSIYKLKLLKFTLQSITLFGALHIYVEMSYSLEKYKAMAHERQAREPQAGEQVLQRRRRASAAKAEAGTLRRSDVDGSKNLEVQNEIVIFLYVWVSYTPYDLFVFFVFCKHILKVIQL